MIVNFKSWPDPAEEIMPMKGAGDDFFCRPGKFSAQVICKDADISYREQIEEGVITMTSPVAETSSPGQELYGMAAGQSPEKTAKATSGAKSGKVHPEGDSVTLSLSAKVKKLKDEGVSADEIASRLNMDVKTVSLYLGIAHVPAATLAQKMKQEGESVAEIADRLNVDAKVVDLYLGIARVPAAKLAQQLKEEGESVVEIANDLGLDVKTVHRYLGTADEQPTLNLEL